ncbi:hypothetical protein M409DRAFT_29484 [Zasmidium cellare ATCC 36951]|uniref:Uncharacterized protein n=1 Tax=Zasmidium cellare ATCC 36951 TaxID=1080233 RepID=A0A6A6C2F1_ZASCE|nr:uncharacterized protein M409DRAFT_29484 [Zasmidium cellare ATCC 36951]KAF2160032.1 hypothetical protein M409DRAFT_29484 [Zasmidium cellare ATCC 36951]
MPHLPHGAQAQKRARTTLFPWYVKVDPDGDALEIPGSGSWTDLNKSHRDLVAPHATPSGFPNMYGKIQSRFPAAVKMPSLGPLCDALIAQRRWSDPSVVKECREVLEMICEDDPSRWMAYVEAWRKKAAEAVHECWKLVEQLEEEAYPDKGYFANGENWGAISPPDESIEVD